MSRLWDTIMDLKIVNRVSQFPKIVDFEDLVEIRSGLFQLSFSYQKSVTRVQFWKSKFHVAPYLCRPKQNQVYEDKSVNKSTRSSRPPRFHETHEKTDVISLPPWRRLQCPWCGHWTTNYRSTGRLMLTRRIQLNKRQCFKNSKPLRSKQVRPWFS
jgi:hypothetical protein